MMLCENGFGKHFRCGNTDSSPAEPLRQWSEFELARAAKISSAKATVFERICTYFVRAVRLEPSDTGYGR